MQTTSLTTPRLVLALVASGVIGGAGATFIQNQHAHATPVAITSTSAPLLPGTALAPAVTAPDFSQVTERFGPAVVNISVTGSSKRGAVADSDDEESTDASPGRQDDPRNDPFFEFFRRFQGQNGQQGQIGRAHV